MGRLSWRLAEVAEVRPETGRVVTLALEVPGWDGHLPGQHVDVRLTAEDGYRAERGYSIASAPDGRRVELTVERLDDGEVSPYLAGELRQGDQLELRGPVGGYFVWEPGRGGPLLLVAGGSGVVPLMAMLRHRAAAGSQVPARLLYSSRTLEDVIFREELDRLAAAGDGLTVTHALTRAQPPGWTGYARRIDAVMLEEVGWRPGERTTEDLDGEGERMLWVTRPSPHIDRTACAWLIRRFVDPEATFAFAPDPDGAAVLGGTPFDMRGVELGHHEGRCSFETILHKYELRDPALDEIAAIASGVLFSKLLVTVSIPADAISIGTRLGCGVYIRARPMSCSLSCAA